MALYTAAEIKDLLTALNARIIKAETAQSYGAGAGMQVARGDLAAMYRERERLEKLYAQAEVTEAGGSTAYAQFEGMS